MCWCSHLPGYDDRMPVYLGENGFYAGGTSLTSGHMIACAAKAGISDLPQWLAEQYAAGTPVTVVYALAEPYAVQLDPNSVPALPGLNHLWSDTGETWVSGRAHPMRIMGLMEERLAARENALAVNG